MKTAEARALVTLLAAGYPNVALERASFDVYVAALAHCGSATLGKRVVEGFISNSPRWPSVAALLAAYNEEAQKERKRRAEAVGLPEPEGGPPPPEAVAELKRIGVWPEVKTVDEGIRG